MSMEATFRLSSLDYAKHNYPIRTNKITGTKKSEKGDSY